MLLVQRIHLYAQQNILHLRTVSFKILLRATTVMYTDLADCIGLDIEIEWLYPCENHYKFIHVQWFKEKYIYLLLKTSQQSKFKCFLQNVGHLALLQLFFLRCRSHLWPFHILYEYTKYIIYEYTKYMMFRRLCWKSFLLELKKYFNRARTK